MTMLNLKSADNIEILTIMDNSLDLLMSNQESVQRHPLTTNIFLNPLPIAEHGFSTLIDVNFGSERHRILFDTGVSESGILHNMNTMNIEIDSIDAIVVSHGHTDHVMGIQGLLKNIGRSNIPFIIHPDSYLPRKLILPNGHEINIPPPNRSELLDANIELIESVGPSMLFDDISLVSGEISRTTEFETGFPLHYSKRDGKWEPDPLICDDQCIIINVRGKGLVIVTGCGHAGIINIIRNAQAITGINKVFFVMGGFHLTGPIFEPIITPTIRELEKINPSMIVPGHCTGWKAIHLIAQNMPNAYIPNSVGTKFII